MPFLRILEFDMFKTRGFCLFNWSTASLSCVKLTDQPLGDKKKNSLCTFLFLNTPIATSTNHHLPSGSQVVHVKPFFLPLLSRRSFPPALKGAQPPTHRDDHFKCIRILGVGGAFEHWMRGKTCKGALSFYLWVSNKTKQDKRGFHSTHLRVSSSSHFVCILFLTQGINTCGGPFAWLSLVLKSELAASSIIPPLLCAQPRDDRSLAKPT